MLVLTRQASEQIQIGEDITITVVRTGTVSIRLGIDAPKHLNIVRTELVAARPAEAPVAARPAA